MNREHIDAGLEKLERWIDAKKRRTVQHREMENIVRQTRKYLRQCGYVSDHPNDNDTLIEPTND